MQSEKGMQINFFTPGDYNLATPGKQVLTVRQSTVYPQSGEINITVTLKKSEYFEIAIRKPAWSANTTLTVNEEELQKTEINNTLSIRRTWKSGDQIKVIVDMSPVLHKAGEQESYFAITSGPIVLARDMRLGPVDTDDAVLPVSDGKGMLVYDVTKEGQDSHDKHKKVGFWVTARVKCQLESHGEKGPRLEYVPFCDYASAGNTYNSDSRFRVWSPLIIDPTKTGK
jgi:DUF1680 family protein